MKIALLYSGSVRTLAETIMSNLEYFDYKNNQIDLYFDLWDYVGYVDHLNAPDYIKSKRVLGKDTVITASQITHLLPSHVCVKKIKIEKYDPNNYTLELINGTKDNLHAQYYKIWDCYQLVDQSIEYDFMVRLRCDMTMNNKISNHDLLNLVNQDKIVFNSKIWYDWVKDKDNQNINEMIWVAKSGLMKQACNIYNNVDLMNQIILSRDQKFLNYGENICYLNLEAEGLVDKIHLFDFDYRVLR